MTLWIFLSKYVKAIKTIITAIYSISISNNNFVFGEILWERCSCNMTTSFENHCF